jgi:hypothetical protein
MAQDPRAIATDDDPRFGGRRPLLDMNEDGRISFGDTFLGDLLGADGRAGVQGPGMLASMGGARRQRAIQMMQEQGVPMTEQNLQRVMTQMPGDGGGGGGTDPTRPQMRPQTAAPAEMGPNAPAPAPTDAATDTDDANVADGAGVPAALAALGVTGAMMRRLNRTGTTGDPAMDIEVSRVLNGEVLGPETPQGPRRVGNATSRAALPAPSGDDVTVSVNPVRSDNMLPAPNAPPQTAQPTDNGITLPRQAPSGGEQAILDYINSVDTPPTAPPTTARPQSPDAATAPITAEEVMNTPQALPEGVRDAPEYTQPSQATTRVDTGQRGPNNEMIFRDPNTREFVTTVQGGRTIAAPTVDALMQALRAIR